MLSVKSMSNGVVSNRFTNSSAISNWFIGKRLSLATLTKGTLETGINFSATEDEVDADSMDYGGTAQGPPSPAESDRDSDDTGDERDPRPEGQPA